jgi:hypothetical protein
MVCYPLTIVLRALFFTWTTLKNPWLRLRKTFAPMQPESPYRRVLHGGSPLKKPGPLLARLKDFPLYPHYFKHTKPRRFRAAQTLNFLSKR